MTIVAVCSLAVNEDSIKFGTETHCIYDKTFCILNASGRTIRYFEVMCDRCTVSTEYGCDGLLQVTV